MLHVDDYGDDDDDGEDDDVDDDDDNKGIRDAGSTADYRILFEIFET